MPDLRVFAVVFLAASLATPLVAQNSGADIYKAKCQMCHGADGLGATPVGKVMKIPSFKDPAVVKSTNAELSSIVKNGKNKMPSFSGKLTDAQITSVVEFIRTLQK